MTCNRVVAAPPRQAGAHIRKVRSGASLVLGTVMLVLVGCTGPAAPRPAAAITSSTTTTFAAAPLASRTVPAAPHPPEGAQPQLASDPVQLADDLVADERALRDPSTAEPALEAAAHREQAAYRAIGRHP